jgi:hypothetical protein
MVVRPRRRLLKVWLFIGSSFQAEFVASVSLKRDTAPKWRSYRRRVRFHGNAKACVLCAIALLRTSCKPRVVPDPHRVK